MRSSGFKIKKGDSIVIKINACIVLLSGLFLCGCAVLPENIPPAYVSYMLYNSWTCEQLAEEQQRLLVALSEACDAQRLAHSQDAAGVCVFGMPVSSMSGANQASYIARLKGELAAVHKSMILKNCEQEISGTDYLKTTNSISIPKEQMTKEERRKRYIESIPHP